MPAPSTVNSRERLLNTVRFISEHPHQAAWRALLPFSVFGASGFGAANQRDENLYRILFFLSLMGARESIHRLNTHLKTQTKEHDVVSNIYESLCEAVDDICSARDDKGELLWPRSVVKRLRKNLHDYARNNGFETRVVNIRDIAEGTLAREALARVRKEAIEELLKKNSGATEQDKTFAGENAAFEFDAQQFIVNLRQDSFQAITDRAITIEQELTGSDQKFTKSSHYRVIKNELNDAQKNHLDALHFFAEQKHKANRFVHKSSKRGEKSDALTLEQEKNAALKKGLPSLHW